MDEEEVKLDLDKGPLFVSTKEPYARLEKIKNRKGKIVKKMVCGVSIFEPRKLKLIEILLSEETKKAYVDCVTGSLYDAKTGICLSSPNLHIVK